MHLYLGKYLGTHSAILCIGMILLVKSEKIPQRMLFELERQQLYSLKEPPIRAGWRPEKDKRLP